MTPSIALIQGKGSRARVVSPMGVSFARVCKKLRYLTSNPDFQRSKVRTLFRLFRWRMHCALNIPAIVDLPQWKARFYLPPRWHGGGTTMIYALRESYEAELLHLDRFLSPGMIGVDGGSNCGIYTVAAARLVGPSGMIFSFEPGKEAFSTLETNVLLNGLSNVRPYHAALSDRPGTGALYHHPEGPNSFSLGPPDTGKLASEDVTFHSLDQVMPKELVPRIGLIKLDVEGAEELVLRGARDILAHSHPTVIFEMHNTAAKRLGLDPVASWRMLSILGYKFFLLASHGSLCPLESPPAASTPINLIALHGNGLP